MAPPKRKFPSAHMARRSKKPKLTSNENEVQSTAPLHNALVDLYNNVTLCDHRNTVIGNDPGPNNGVFTLFIYGKEGLAANHGLCVPMKVDLFQELPAAGKKHVESSTQACRDRLVDWIRNHEWVPSQASMVVIERQLIACQREGQLNFANQKTNTLATTLESKWEDIVIDEKSRKRLPIAPISKESFHFAYPDIFPVPPKGGNAHDFNKDSVVRYAEHKDSLLAPFERQWVEADFTRNYYAQLAAGRSKTPKREADDYYDSAIFAMGGYEYAHAPANRPRIIEYRKNNTQRLTLDLLVCPNMEMTEGCHYELLSDGNRLMLVFHDVHHPLLTYLEILSDYAFNEGAVMKVGNKHRLQPSALRQMRAEVLDKVRSSSELAAPVDLTNEQ